MTTKARTRSNDGDRVTRAIWLVCFAVPLVMLAILAVAGSAQALDDPEATVLATEFSTEPGDAFAAEATEEEECVISEGEEEDELFEELEGECEAEAEDAGPFPPEDCLLRTAKARVLASPEQDKVDLTVRYSLSTPTSVSVTYRAKGGKGALQLGGVTRRLGARGQLRLTERLNELQMAKVRAAHDFSVQLHVPAAPAACNRFFSRRLAIKQTRHKQLVWSQSDSIFGT